MHHEGPIEIVVLLLAAVAIVTIFKRLQLSPVLGYLVAGSIIGPFGLGIISDMAKTDYIAEFGIVFLLFIIGLELTFDRLKAMRAYVFGYGLMQILLTTGIISAFTHYVIGLDAISAFIIGGGLAFSSTAVVLQVIADRGKQSSQAGRLGLATLIMQDLAVVPFLIMIPLLKSEGAALGTVLLTSLGQAFLALAVIFVIGKQLLRPLFALIASLKSEELFMATTLLIVLGTATATNELGLSMALGAFVAGLLVAETEYTHQVTSDIKPFKGLLMGLFFMTIGMKIDFAFIKDVYVEIIVFTFALMVVKGLIIVALSKASGFKLGCSIQTGFLLCQGSEFAFVLFGLATETALLPEATTQLLLVVVSVSIALTPPLAILGEKLARRVEKRNPVHLQADDMEKETRDLHDHVIVAGYGRVGKTTCKLLSLKDIKYIAIDEDPKNVHEGRRNGVPVYYGNADRMDIMKSLGIERAKIIAITVDNRKEAVHIARTISKAYPKLMIVARARDRFHAKDLYEAGAKIAMAEMFESSILLGGTILRHSGETDSEIERIIDVFRAEEYPISQFKEVFHHDPPEQKT